MIRQKLIDSMQGERNGLYEELKSRFICKFSCEGRLHNLSCEEIDQFSDCGIDHWFKGCIDSLYYKPNKFLLVLNGVKGNPLRHLHSSIVYGEQSVFTPLLYEKFIYLFDEYECNVPGIKSINNLIEDDFFKIDNRESRFSDGTPHVLVDKRLSSFVVTTNSWTYPQRKKIIVLDIESINIDKYNEINNKLLWIDIFNKFKT